MEKNKNHVTNYLALKRMAVGLRATSMLPTFFCVFTDDAPMG